MGVPPTSVCVLEIYIVRYTLVTDGIRQRLNHVSAADRWTSRDHDLSKPVGRRSALHQLEMVRPQHALFYPQISGSWSRLSNGRRSDREKIHGLLLQLLRSTTGIPWRCARHCRVYV